MQLVLLPGMDGTGHLFRPVVNQLEKQYPIKIVRYPAVGEQRYTDLAAYVQQALPIQEPFALIAESFSGPLAYTLATKPCPGLTKVFFVSTFLSNPAPMLLTFRSILPVGLGMQLRMPDWVVKRYLLGEAADQALIHAFWLAIQTSGKEVLTKRIRTIATLTAPTQRLDLPCIYLQATDDRLVSKRSLADFRRLCQQLKVYSVDGKHFLLQSSPKKCAEIIDHELRGNEQNAFGVA